MLLRDPAHGSKGHLSLLLLLVLLLPPRPPPGRPEGGGSGLSLCSGCRKVSLGPLPGGCVHQNSVSRTADPAKQTCRSGAEPRREQAEGLRARGWAWVPEVVVPGPARPTQAQGGVGSQMLAPSWFSLALPRQSGVALALPREQVAFAAWHLFLRAAAREVQTRGSPCVSSEPLHEAWLLPGGARPGLSWWRRSQRGLSLIPESRLSPSR